MLDDSTPMTIQSDTTVEIETSLNHEVAKPIDSKPVEVKESVPEKLPTQQETEVSSLTEQSNRQLIVRTPEPTTEAVAATKKKNTDLQPRHLDR